MKLRYATRTPKPEFEVETGALRVELGGLFREADVLSLHVPAVPELRGVVNAENLGRMKPGAILVNTSRGDLVREDALAAALESGQLGAAGLDVYAEEPSIQPRLLAAPRTVLLPHIGSATRDTRRAMAGLALANVQAVLAGKAPLTPVYR
jgi:glyoxylate reductase